MNEAILWFFLMNPMMDNQALIQNKHHEKSHLYIINDQCVHRSNQKLKMNQKTKIKPFKRAVYHQSNCHVNVKPNIVQS